MMGPDTVDALPPATATPLSGPAVWTGPALAADPRWRFRLDAADNAAIAEALASAQRRGLGPDDLGDDIDNFPLPALTARLMAMSGELRHGSGVALLAGLEAARYTAEELALIFRGIGCHLGVTVSQNHKGETLGRVIDLSDRMADPRRYQAGGEFRMHIDPIDVVGLMCVRKAKAGGESQVVSALAVHNVLLAERPDLLPLLYRGYYLYRPKLDRGAAPALTPARVPVFAPNAAGEMNTYCIPDPVQQAVRRENVVLSAAEAEALDVLDEIAHRPALRLEMDLVAGDMQFLNNRLVLHGRTGYADHPELERRRLMLRLWLMVPGWPALDPRQRFFDDGDKLGGGIPRRAPA